MEQFQRKIEEMLKMIGFKESRVNVDVEYKKISLFIEDELVQTQTPMFLSVFDHVINLILHKEGMPAHIIDLNYYRKERERLIMELARAAAKKAMVTKEEVKLPPMNSYERRLVHMEITTHPELKTESMGEGKERCVVIKHLSV